MRIVVLSQWYTPEPARLISGLAETLHEMNHDVTVLTGFPNYPTGKLYPGYRLKLWQSETINGVRVIRVPLFPSHDKSAIKRIVNYVSFAVSASLLGLFLVRRPDVIHVYHPPLTAVFPAWFLSRLLRVPLTLEIQDLWPETLAATGMVHSPRILRMVGWMAKWFYRRAAAIRVISDGFARNLQSKGIAENILHVIPNWEDAEDDASGNGCVASIAILGEGGKFRVMFAGNMGLAQDLQNVLEAAGILCNLPDIQFVLVGDGVDLDHLKQLKHDQNLNNVVFLGRYPSTEMPKLYAQADVLLVHLRDDPLFRITIPHKVYSYMASGKPVLVAAEGDVAETVTKENAGIACRPGDARVLAEAVRMLYRMSEGERQRMGTNGQRAVRDHYNRRQVVQQMEQMMAGVLRSK